MRNVPRQQCKNCFNPRPRAGGDQAESGLSVDAQQFQSAPPRGGRPYVNGMRVENEDVSIRAPARGATSVPAHVGRPVAAVSIRAPARGATPYGAMAIGGAAGFQSAPPRGGRLVAAGEPYSAPAEFQSAPPRGGRPGITGAAARSTSFQSAPPRGGRPAVTARLQAIAAVSIRAPARGATRRSMISRLLLSFQSAPPRGGRRLRVRGRRGSRGRFNPRPRAGGDPASAATAPDDSKFQSAPPRGGRPALQARIDQQQQFQSAPPRGGRP